MTKRRKQTATYPLRLPRSLKDAVREVSRRDGTSINQFVTTAVAEKLSAMTTAEFFAERKADADVDRALRILRRKGSPPPEPERGIRLPPNAVADAAHIAMPPRTIWITL